MRQLRDEAYVLNTRVLGETDLIVSLLAEHHGKVRGVARAARNSRRRFGGVLEPLTRVEAVWVEKESRELHRIDALEARRSFADMQSDPLLQAICAVLAEVSEVFAHEGQPEERGFKLLGAVLEALEDGRDPWISLRYFEYWTLRLHGLLPAIDSCAACAGPTGRRPRVAWGGGLRCPSCVADGEPGKHFGEADVAFLETARRSAPTAVEATTADAGPGSALEIFLRGALETFVEHRFRSYRHLRNLADFRPQGEA